MGGHSNLEKAAWIAGILSLPVAVFSMLRPEPEPRRESQNVAAIAVTAPEPTSTTGAGRFANCEIDVPTADGLRRSGIYSEVVYLCNSGKAVTVGQSFRIASIHPDPRFQYFNPVEFVEARGIPKGTSASAAMYQDISEKLSRCFSSTYELGMSPLERIDLELECIERIGLHPQDKVFVMLVENAHAEGRNEPA